MTKTITNPQLIGARGESFVSERANAIGFMFSPYGKLEAGLDGLLEIRDPATGAATGQLVAVQVKAKESGSYTSETDTSFEYLMNEEDAAYWRGCNLPVIVVLVHLERGEAYWRSADTGTGPGGRRLSFDKNHHVFDANARDAIADICVAKGGFGVWFPALKTGENGHLNLLEVILPKDIYIAASPFKTGRHALRELLDHDERPPDDWIVRGGQFMSFRDPREGPLKNIVDLGAVDVIGTDEVAFPDDEADEYNFIDLLRRTLGVQLDGVLAFNRAQRAFYFPAVPETVERRYHYRSLKNPTSAGVVQKYEKNGKLNYVRHHAFEPRFWRIGDRWFLTVTPTFVFTWDGFRPDKFAASRLAGKKQQEHNSALLGQFVMWRYLLVAAEKDGDTDTGALFEENGLKFRPLSPLMLSRGVPDELWRATEPASADPSRERLAV